MYYFYSRMETFFEVLFYSNYVIDVYCNVYPCILSIANEDFVSFVNFSGPGDKPLGKTTNFKSYDL